MQNKPSFYLFIYCLLFILVFMNVCIFTDIVYVCVCIYIYFCCSFYFCTSSCIQLVRVSFIFFLSHGLFMESQLLKVVCSISHSDEHHLDLPHTTPSRVCLHIRKITPTFTSLFPCCPKHHYASLHRYNQFY